MWGYRFTVPRINTRVEIAWLQRLTLRYEVLLASARSVNLRHYTGVSARTTQGRISLMCYVIPDYHTKLHAFPCCVPEGETPKYEAGRPLLTST
jgi:hypothetical protein